jgi:hypothetical protein
MIYHTLNVSSAAFLGVSPFIKQTLSLFLLFLESHYIQSGILTVT